LKFKHPPGFFHCPMTFLRSHYPEVYGGLKTFDGPHAVCNRCYNLPDLRGVDVQIPATKRNALKLLAAKSILINCCVCGAVIRGTLQGGWTLYDSIDSTQIRLKCVVQDKNAKLWTHDDREPFEIQVSET
jgi:hypothetical protein